MGAPNPRPQKATVTVGASTITLYAKLAELAPFLGTITEDAVPTVVIDDQTVSGHNRRRYPGGPLVGVASHSRRRVLEDPKPDQTLPGYNAWLERGSGLTLQVEQFTYTGSFQDLKDYVKANAEIPCILRSPWGAAYEISAVA